MCVVQESTYREIATCLLLMSGTLLDCLLSQQKSILRRQYGECILKTI